MSLHKIGKLKEIRTTIANPGDETYSEYISTLNLNTELYDDITSIENWYAYGHLVCTDFLQMRLRIKEILEQKTWENCTIPERDVILEVYTRETIKTVQQGNTEKIIHLMTSRGLSQAQAIAELQSTFARFHIREIQSCNKRSNSEKVFTIVAKYLSISDGADFTRVISTPFHLYTSRAITGVNDSEAGEGIFDFIESTPGTTYENAGLAQQGYVMQNGDLNTNNFISELMDVLKYGNY